MINALKALGWLNAIDNCSQLNNEDRQLIRQARLCRPDDLYKSQLLERLRNAARSSSNPLKKAEILLNCAVVGKWRTSVPQAARDAQEALISYDTDKHRRAVALWILGIIQWDMLQNDDAYRNWIEAKNIFKHCQSSSPHPVIENNWYGERLRQMEVELVVHPEEIETWLNRFELSSLGMSTRPIVNCAREKIRRRAYPSVYFLMQDLQEANRQSEKIYERAEIFLEFGLAIYQMGNSYFAMELLRNAVLDFYPGIGTYHKQVVARCMLGALEWMHNSSGNQAAEHWKHSIDQFENLRWLADRDNLPQKEEWYSEHRDILRSALLERVKPPKQTPDSNLPNESKPTPPQSPPRSGKAALYHDLLNKVGGDQATADRLIEYERTKAHTADRDELIRRAIGRWLRDNR